MVCVSAEPDKAPGTHSMPQEQDTPQSWREKPGKSMALLDIQERHTHVLCDPSGMLPSPF